LRGRVVFVRQRRAQGRHAGCGHDERVAVERGADQREARMRALRDHLAAGVGHHPVPVVREAGVEQLGAVQRDAAAGLDRIDE